MNPRNEAQVRIATNAQRCNPSNHLAPWISKFAWLPSVALLCLCVVLAGCSGEDAKEAASGVTKKIVEVTKSTVTGLDEGLEAGRKSAESIDGAIIVNTREEFAQALTVEVLTVRHAQRAGLVEVVAGFRNDAATPVRVTEMIQPGNLMILDKEGFATAPAQLPETFTVPARAKLKVSFFFEGSPDKVGVFRIHDSDHVVPDGAVDLTPVASTSDGVPAAGGTAPSQP